MVLQSQNLRTVKSEANYLEICQFFNKLYKPVSLISWLSHPFFPYPFSTNVLIISRKFVPNNIEETSNIRRIATVQGDGPISYPQGEWGWEWKDKTYILKNAHVC